MNITNGDLMLRKEGIYWTMYFGDHQMGCGFLEDMIEELESVAKRLDAGEDENVIVADYTEFR